MTPNRPPDPCVLPIEALEAHPANSNVMPEPLMDKLAGEIGASGRYPPVIVRPLGERYQILDGHHRVAVLRKLGYAKVQCVVWDVDDEQALLLLATLNRLRGDDRPRKRAALVAQLRASMGVQELARRLPEGAERVKKLLELHAAPPSPRPPEAIDQMPACLTFFLPADKRSAVERVLREHGGTREQALLERLGIGRGASHE